MAKKPLSKRARARERAIRRDPFGRFGQELNRYLRTVGWTAVVVGRPQIRGFERPGVSGLGNYEFCVQFSGGRRPTPVVPRETSQTPKG